jgi:hypothetical protein
MSSGRNDDYSNTRAVVSGAMPKVSSGKTWLGHLENKQSGLIDLLILAGIYSIKEIALKIEYVFPAVTNSETASPQNHERCCKKSPFQHNLICHGIIRRINA